MLVQACLTDLPKRMSGKETGDQIAAYSAKACPCIFNYAQATNDLSSDAWSDGDYRLLALMMQKGTLTKSDVPDNGKRMSIGLVGGFYPAAAQKPEVQTCIQN
jgi:hypothetical protein